jgi:lipid-binding SYLF domain-containing protein
MLRRTFIWSTPGSFLALGAARATGQVNAFVLTNTGLMAGASLQGTKVTRLASL